MLAYTLSLSVFCLLTSSLSSALSLPPDGHVNDKRYSSLPDYAQRNLDTIRKIYNLTVYPNNVPIVNHGAEAVPPGLFNQDATGRVSPVGNFSGFADSIEYFFALAPTPQISNGIGFYAADVVEFTSGCPEVAASLVYLRTAHINKTTGKIDHSKPKSTLSQVAFWRFDEEGKVLKYHAWIPNLQAWTAAAVGINFNNIALQKVAKVALCPGIQKLCTGKDQQYSSELSCIAQLQLKPFGTFDEAWGDNIVCRTIHLILTRIRPDVHCPHVGPLGGAPPDNYKCVDIDYSKEYFDDATLFGAPEGDVFSCGGPLLSGNSSMSLGGRI